MNPKGQHLFEIYTALSHVRVASYTSHTLPCLNTKQVAVKLISKDQQTLRTFDLSGLKFIQFKTDLIAARALDHSHSIKKASNNESIRFK